MKMTPCNDYFFVLDRVKPITEGVIESWLVGAEPKFRDIIDGKVRQHRFVCKSNKSMLPYLSVNYIPKLRGCVFSWVYSLWGLSKLSTATGREGSTTTRNTR